MPAGRMAGAANGAGRECRAAADWRGETGTTEVTRVNAFAVHWDWDRGEGCGPCIPERRLGFAKPEEAADALSRMRKTLNEHGYRRILTSRSIDEFDHRWVHEYYCQD